MSGYGQVTTIDFETAGDGYTPSYIYNSGNTDALEFIIAGASAVGIGTGLYYDPLICASINQTICDYLTDNNLTHISQLVGSLTLN